ncbi:hypothetical protein [Laspinema olomoucense]|uniref:hypothetical protein n=1 Tax=Laspinema olomoucense TaxID=3231600 RepID=UPI0021BA7595|nr:hypothetical protein [Laspinema sp. D3d]MCT7972599.1 hypothetical protein [Laspinema sp. D3d]
MLGYDFNVIDNKLQELENAKIRANYFKSLYDGQTKKRNDLQQEVDSLKKIIMDLAGPIHQLEKVLAAASIANILAAAPIEHNSSLQKDETYVDNEEIDEDDDN